jgi:PAS domain S-box-containing protein
MSYLKKEFYELLKNDFSVFDFIQEWGVDGLSYRDIEYEENEWINSKFWSTLGCDSTEMPNRTSAWRKIIHPDDLKKANQIDFVEFDEILRYKHKNGGLVTVRCKALPIKDNDGTTTRILSAYTKITHLEENKEEEETLKQQLDKYIKQEDFLKKCNEAARIGYWEVNLLNDSIYWSSMTKEIHEAALDYEPNLQTAINFFKEGESRELITKSFELAVSEGLPYDHELQIVTLKGNSRWVRSIAQVTFSDGVCTRVYGTFQDITQFKNSNIELLQEKEKLLSVIEGTNAGTWEWNIQTGETHYNELWAKILGYSLKELEPIDIKTWKNLVHPDDIGKSDEELNDCFEKKTEYYNSEYRMRHKDGHYIWVLDKGKVISWTEDGKPLMMFGTQYDITEQKKIINRNTVFIEQTPTAIAMFDTNMCYLASSEKWKEDYNLKDKSIIGKSHYELFPEIGTEWKNIHQKCLNGFAEKRDEDKFIRKEGTVQWLKWEVKPWYNDNGTVGGIIMYTADITARKNTQEQLRISEEAFRGNFENAAIGMALLDKKGNWLKVNRSLCTMLGYSEQELMVQSFEDITHPDDLEADLKLLDELVKGRRSFYHMEKRYICKNGRIINIILAASLVRNAENQPLYFISQIIDITPQKNAERELADTISKMQSLIEASTQVSIIETDKKGTITTFNKGAENLLGYSKEEVLFKQTPALIHLKEEVAARALEIKTKYNDIVEGFKVFTYAANKGEYDTREWTYIKKDGTELPVQLTVTAIKTEGKITGYLGIAVDISYIKKTEKEIQSLLLVTKDQNERLRNFAHIVSHNLRSHSGNITMMLDLLNFEFPDLSGNEFIQLLGTASENLKETIAHLNEVVLINTSLSENLQNLELHEYMDNTIKNVSVIAQKAEVQIDNQIDPQVKILAIPAYLDSILLNFITNGIKYRSPDRDSFIKISSTTNDEFVILTIEDNGIGIDLKKNRDKLFGMYKTFHSNKDARGIGLFITKNQIEAIGGKVKVESIVNKGTTFKIYFKHEKN